MTKHATDFDLPVLFTDPSDRLFNEEKMYTYVRAFAAANALDQTARVLQYAREKHSGQVRAGKEHIPYISHPLSMACHALALELVDDNLISACLLHDVCEDCDVEPEELPVNEETREIVRLLTNREGKSREVLDRYYEALSKNKKAVIVKLLDRCNNISTMTGAFSEAKIKRYIEETEGWIYPLMKTAKYDYPEYSDEIFLIKYHIISVISSLKHVYS